MLSILPYFTKGTIVKGFGRGAKQLGFPTANFSEEVTDLLPKELKSGIYYGWARVEEGGVFPMVASIGFNPFYSNTKKTIEIHIIHEFEGDLYGRLLRVCMAGWIRDEQNFESLEALVQEIKNDIEVAMEKLAKPEMEVLKDHEYFKDF